MYASDKYRERRPDTLLAAIEEINFATVIGTTPEGPEAVHVPLVVGSDGDEVWLDGHVSLNNPIKHLIDDGAPVLAVFSGPNAYVSPNWMAETGISGRTAPTWAYIAVQVRGPIEWCMEAGWLREHVAALTDAAERSIGSDWSTSRMPEEYAAALIGGIVGFTIRVRAMQGVWKVMQHSAAADRERMVSGLRIGNAGQAMMADAIAAGVRP